MTLTLIQWEGLQRRLKTADEDYRNMPGWSRTPPRWSPPWVFSSSLSGVAPHLRGVHSAPPRWGDLRSCPYLLGPMVGA